MASRNSRLVNMLALLSSCFLAACVDLTRPWSRQGDAGKADAVADQVAETSDVSRALDAPASDGTDGVSETGGVDTTDGGIGSGGTIESGGTTGAGGTTGLGGVTGSGGGAGWGGAGGGSGRTTGSGGTGAAEDAGPDSGTASTDTASLRCGGVEDSGICWYLGSPGDSCATVCALHGGNSPQAASHVGVASQGGSSIECGRLLALLGRPGGVVSGTRSDGMGLGCLSAAGLLVWLSSPPYSDSAKAASIQLVCGCLE